MMVRPTHSRTAEQTACLEQLISSNKTIGVVFKLAQDFGRPLHKRQEQCVWNNGKPLSGPVGLQN